MELSGIGIDKMELTPMSVSYLEHTSPLFRKLVLPKLEDIYKLQLCKLI